MCCSTPSPGPWPSPPTCARLWTPSPPAGRVCPGPGRGARRAADGRAVQRPGRAHRRNLRSELAGLWQQQPDFPTKAMLLVTHNIDEAVLLADRVLVLSANPGRIRTELQVDLPRPRDRH